MTSETNTPARTTQALASEASAPRPRRLFVRGPWENAATVLIALGVVMLMQPFSLWLFGWSFGVVLTGTILFVIVSHFPE